MASSGNNTIAQNKAITIKVNSTKTKTEEASQHNINFSHITFDPDNFKKVFWSVHNGLISGYFCQETYF